MISYNNKFFNIATILMVIYVFYSANQKNPSLFNDWKTTIKPSAANAQHTITIDPQKPDSQKSFFERVATYLYSDEISQAINQISGNNLNKYGDKIIYLFKKYPTNQSEKVTVMTLAYIVGITDAPEYVKDALKNAKVGEKLVFNISSTEQAYLEVTAIEKSNFNK